MALPEFKRQEIIEQLIREIGRTSYTGSFNVKIFSDSCGISPQSVYRYLKKLEEDGVITKARVGNQNNYLLVDENHYFTRSLTGLSEDVVWTRDIKPLIHSFSPIVLNVCNYAFTEMLNNAIDHSEGSTALILVSINAFRVSFILSDDGVGIFSKIAAALNLEEKRFAVLELAKGRFTTAPESHTGEGIFFSAKAADVFSIISDDLIFVTSPIFGEDEILIERSVKGLGGTTVVFDVFRDHDIPLSEVFDRYAQDPDEYGFTKTTVPVTLLEFGDQNPTFVSRSQAKRLLARFERFMRIELDFTGVDDIGQGFADEVFRVFKTQHPNSEIVAVNCNGRVRRMINRVTGGSN